MESLVGVFFTDLILTTEDEFFSFPDCLSSRSAFLKPGLRGKLSPFVHNANRLKNHVIQLDLSRNLTMTVFKARQVSAE